jgi:conjugal transfer pilus assembly protein TraF
MYRLFIVLLISFYGLVNATELSWYEDSRRGFNWFEENPARKKACKKKRKNINYVNIIKSWKKRYEYLLNRAIVTQDEQDIKEYLEFEHFMISHSANFAGVRQIVIAKNPQLDFTMDYPISRVGQQSYKAVQNKKKELLVKNLSKNHDFVFFYKGTCKYCHDMARIVKNFSKKYGWGVLPVSIDGGLVKEFPNSKIGKKQFDALGLGQVPALIAFNRDTGKWLPIAYGVQSYEEIIDRIMLFNGYRGAYEG